jgi:NAD(P)-dependent dehydrogenase (short-subunit alcohol dehydrogenase family)
LKKRGEESCEVMSLQGKVAIVTGANKGIGFFITKKLFESGAFSHVILTARNTELGETAKKEIVSNSPSSNTTLLVRQLDVSEVKSIENFVEGLKNDFPNGIDSLVNNAGFAFKGNATEPVEEQARITVGVNYTGTLQLTKRVLPLLRDGGNIVMVSSRLGLFSMVSSEALKKEFLSPDLTIERLEELVSQYLEATRNGTHIEKGWPKSTYSTSKVAVNVLTLVLARMYPKLQINSCCPGWCRTDMAGDKAPRSAEEGADTPAFLALSPPAGATGLFFGERKTIDLLTQFSF